MIVYLIGCFMYYLAILLAIVDVVVMATIGWLLFKHTIYEWIDSLSDFNDAVFIWTLDTVLGKSTLLTEKEYHDRI